jgi:hypothetical protein
MNVIFGKSMWGSFPCSTEAFLDRAKADGFEAVELMLCVLPESPERVAELCYGRGLKLIAQIATEGTTPDGHEQSLERRIREAAEGMPDRINVHTGKDFFSHADNEALFRKASILARELAVRIVHETHRGRALFTAPETATYLRSIPDLRLCADFSHWMVVHESDLKDQPDAVEQALCRTDYIHARVGFAEGPQVPHPLAPEYAVERECHLALWRRIRDLRRAENADSLLITTEFGPVPYMPRLPFTGLPVADEWRVNVEFRDWLRARLDGSQP